MRSEPEACTQVRADVDLNAKMMLRPSGDVRLGLALRSLLARQNWFEAATSRMSHLLPVRLFQHEMRWRR